MSAPSDVAVTVRLLAVRGIGALPDREGRPFMTATIADRRLGRSREIPDGEDGLDLTGEPSAWERRLTNPGAIRIAVTVWDERGDAGPELLRTIDGTLHAPFVSGPRTIATSNGALDLEVSVARGRRKRRPAAVPRVVEGSQTVATIHVRNVVRIEIVAIEGLFRPTADGVIAEPGYVSQDDRGRIYTNRLPDDTWASDQQHIVMHARVHVISGRLPPGARMTWTLVDVDDPTDDDVFFHRQAGRLIDAADYDASSGAHTGAAGSDNRGAAPSFEAVAPHDAAPSGATATSSILDAESRIQIRTSKRAGDNYIVRVGVDAPDVSVLEAETGIMTMWHRLDVEYRVMEGALELPIDPAVEAFEVACIQLDFTEPRPLAYQSPLAVVSDQFYDVVDPFAAASLSEHRKPGWLGVIAARLPYPPPTKPPEPPGGWPKATVQLTSLFDGTHEQFDVPGELHGANAVELRWTEPGGKQAVAKFSIQSEVLLEGGPSGPAFTRCTIGPDDGVGYTPRFTADDGSEAHAYADLEHHFPRRVFRDGSLTTGPGYQAPETVEATIMKTVGMTAGIGAATTLSDQLYFNGAVLLFTQVPKFVDGPVDPLDPGPYTPNALYSEAYASFLTHELLHAFGLPHICGGWDHVTPRRHTCAGNYSHNWAFDERGDLEPESEGRSAHRICGKHLHELRNVDFSRMKALTGW